MLITMKKRPKYFFQCSLCPNSSSNRAFCEYEIVSRRMAKSSGLYDVDEKSGDDADSQNEDYRDTADERVNPTREDVEI